MQRGSQGKRFVGIFSLKAKGADVSIAEPDGEYETLKDSSPDSGSGGRLREILQALREKNPNVRVVLNAVSLETVAEVVALWKELLICEEEITQIAVSRAKKAGSHHLMQAENPIYVISFSLSENGEGEEQKPDRREER